MSVSATVVTGASWAAAFGGLDRRLMPAFAAMTGVVAALCWVACWRDKRDRDRTILIRALSRTVPMRRP